MTDATSPPTTPGVPSPHHRRRHGFRASQRASFGVSALFAASAAVTMVRCASMAAMGDMAMPGGWIAGHP